MPTISRFYGIRIGMFHREHEPAHFHASYGEYEMVVEIASLAVLRGGLPRRAQNMVIEWAAVHQDELVENWSRALDGRPLLPIAPLD